LRRALETARDAGLSFRELERATGVSYAELHRILQGQRPGTRDTAEKVVAGLRELARRQRGKLDTIVKAATRVAGKLR